MNKNLSFALLMIFILGSGFFIWNKYTDTFLPDDLNTPIKTAPPEPSDIDEPKPLFPVPQAKQPANNETDKDPEDDKPAEELPEELTLPILDESDEPLRSALADFFPVQQLAELFDFSDIIRHFTVTVDNATGPKLPRKLSFTQHPADRFVAINGSTEGEYVMDSQNYDRYSGFVHFIEDTDVSNVVYLYFQFYPLFQEAYEELGYPGYYFNDRLVTVIDHILETPEVPDGAKLIKPKVLFKFADPELENLSSSQKILIRIGNKNATKVRHKLKELREALVNPEQ